MDHTDPTSTLTRSPWQPPGEELIAALLTRRERQIYELHGRGLSSKEIAHELSIADATVRVLLSRGMQKLGRPKRNLGITPLSPQPEALAIRTGNA